MASIVTMSGSRGPRYKIWYRDPTGKQRTKTYKKLADARAFKLTIESEIVRGDWIDPQAGRETFEQVAAQWLEVADVKPSTRSGYASVLDKHLLPQFGTTPIAGIATPDVERFLALLRGDKPTKTQQVSEIQPVSAGTVRNVRNVLSAVMRYAQRSGMIRSNPVGAVKTPKVQNPDAEMQFLSAVQVRALAEAIDHRYRLAVLLDAYTGLRAGELWALKVGRIDLLRRRLTVAESVAEVHGAQVTGTPKNRQSRRVPIPKFLVDELTEHLAPIADNPDAYVFTAPHGGPVRHSTFYDRYFQPAAVAAGLAEYHEMSTRVGKPMKTATGRVSKAKAPQRYKGLRFHDLRHTAVSFMIAAGASPLIISRAIGHGSISITYDVYGHVLPDHADEMADGLDAIYSAAVRQPDARVVQLAQPN